MNTQPEPVDDRTHAEALHVLQDIQVNIRDAKRSQWNTTHYAALLYAALVALVTVFNDRMRVTPVEQIMISVATSAVLFVWAVAIGRLQSDIKRRRDDADEIQDKWFTKQFRAYLVERQRSCPARGNDWAILIVLCLVSVGGWLVTLWVIIR